MGNVKNPHNNQSKQLCGRVYETPGKEKEAPKSKETPLSGQNMEAAINIGRYYLEHAKHAYTLMGADEQTDGAKYILKQLEKQEYKTLTRREIFRLCRGRFKKVDSIDPSLCTLSEYGYIRETPTEYKRTGQKPSPTFEINPMFYK